MAAAVSASIVPPEEDASAPETGIAGPVLIIGAPVFGSVLPKILPRPPEKVFTN